MLEPSIPTFIFAALNLIILYVALKRVLFKPVTEFMEKREKSIKDSLDTADRRMAETEELKAQYERQLQTAREAAEDILKEARNRGEKEYSAIVAEARSEALHIIEKAKADMEYERLQMLKEVKNQVASLALAAASKVLERDVDSEDNRALVDKFIDEAGAA